MSQQINLIEYKPAELVHIPLWELKERAKIVGAPASAALVRAIEDGGFEDALHLSVKEDGTYVIRAGNGRLDALIRARYDDDYMVPCFVRQWTGPEDELYLLADHAVQRQNVVAEYMSVSHLIGVMTEKEIARRTGVNLSRVRTLIAISQMQPDILAGFLEGKISAGTATKVARRPLAEQQAMAAILQDSGQLLGKDIERVRKVTSDTAATVFTQTQMFEDFKPVDAFLEDGIAYLSIPGKGRYKISAEKLLDFLDSNKEEETA